MKIKIAEHHWYWKTFFAVWEWINGFEEMRGFTTYWDTIVVREAYKDDKGLIAHEAKHVEQIKRLGVIRFTYEYLLESWRVGYYKNKFEVEAREAAKQVK